MDGGGSILGIERNVGLNWYAVEVVNTTAALRSLLREGFRVDDGNDGRVIADVIPAADFLPGCEVWRPMCLVLRSKRVRGRREPKVDLVRESLFPGYVLARWNAAAFGKDWIEQLNGVGGVICRDGNPWPLQTTLIDSLRAEIAGEGGALRIQVSGRRYSELGREERNLLYARGQQVRVIGGKWGGFNGIIDEDVPLTTNLKIDDGKARAKLLVDIFGRTTQTSVPVALVEPA